MIHSITAQNYHSISDEVTLDFVVDKKAPSTFKYVDADSRTRLSTVATVVGPNASGKTTVLKSLTFVQWLITESFSDSETLSHLYKPFAGSKNKPTSLSTVFEIKGDIFHFSIEMLKDRITSETLSVRSKSQVRKTMKLLYLRKYNEKSKEYVFDISGSILRIPYERMKDDDLKSATLISIGGRYGDEKLQEIIGYWEKVKSNIYLSHVFYMYGHEAMMIMRERSKNKEVEPFVESLKKFGSSGIEKYDAKKHKMQHSSGKLTFDLGIEEESSGTQQLMVLLEKLERVLETGGVAIIDEFDAYLHPTWLNELVNQFFDPTKNPHKAQLVMTTHSIQLLNLLDQYQIFIADKVDGKTEITRLDNVSGVRSDDNFPAKYMAGKYGGIPDIS